MKTKSTNNKTDTVLKHILKNMATKIDLKSLEDNIDRKLKNFATKDDLKQFATKDDLKQFATKDDLKKALEEHPTKKDLKRELDDLAVHLTLSADKHKAEKGDLRKLEKRVDEIEKIVQVAQ